MHINELLFYATKVLIGCWLTLSSADTTFKVNDLLETIDIFDR